MIGSFLTRGLVMVFGYAYPAYECYKTVEKNKPDIEQLRFWCQYWVPMYSEAKLAFVVYLWYPRTKGTTYVYDSFFRPYVAKHENEIDQNLLELRTRAGDMAAIYWQRAASYGQTRIFEILQYVASQSTPRPRPSQPQQHATVRPPPVPNHQPATATHPEGEEPSPPTSSMSSTQHEKDTAEEVGPLQAPEAALPAKTTNPQKPTSTVSTSQKANSATTNAPKANAMPEITSQSILTETVDMQIDRISSANESSNPSPKDTVVEDGRVTRGRYRGNRFASNN